MTKAEDEEDRKRTRHIDVPLGVRLRSLREDRGLTQAELGQMLDISGNQWGRHESGLNRLPAARLWQFCNVLNIDVAGIYEGLPFNIAPRGGQEAEEAVMPARSGNVYEEGAPAPTPPPLPGRASGGQPLVQRIGAVARQLPEARQRTALVIMRALKAQDED